jgi:hypothetical protein
MIGVEDCGNQGRRGGMVLPSGQPYIYLVALRSACVRPSCTVTSPPFTVTSSERE